MKTIGYVLADFPVLSETFVGDEMRAMQSRGHSVVPIVMHLRCGPAQIADRKLAERALRPSDAPAARAFRILMKPSRDALKGLRFVYRQTSLPRLSLIWNAMKIAALAKREGCRHLHAHFSGGAAAHAIVAARWLGVPVSFICHGHDVYAEADDLALKLRSADAVVATCSDMAEDLRRQAPGSKIDIIVCGADPETFRPDNSPDALSRLLFVGRLVEQKGLDDLFAALSLQPDIEVDIVGDGPLRAFCERRVASLGLASRVTLLGARGKEWLQKEAPRYLGLVAPFKVAPDGSRDTGPIVVKEAMAMGLPVVTTRFMGNKDVVTEDTGIMTPAGDPKAFAGAIDALLKMTPEQRREMGARGRARVIEFFSHDVQARALSTLFEGL